MLSSTSRAQISLIVEAAFGITPITGAGDELRMTGESLTHNIGVETSKEIRDDRMKADLVQVSAQAGGDINFEMSYREYDTLIEGALQGSWVGSNDASITVTTTLGTTLTASAGAPFAGIVAGQFVCFAGFAAAQNNQPLVVVTATNTVLTFAAATLANEAAVPVTFTSYGKTTQSATTSAGTTFTAAAGTPFANVVAGQWVRISGMPTAQNNGVFQVVSKTSSTVLVFAGGTFANETGATTTFVASRISNGTTQRSFSIEKNFADIAQFFLYKGMNVSKWTLSLKSGKIVDGAFGFIGKSCTRAGVTGMPGSTRTSWAYEVMNAVSGVGAIYEGGSLLTGTYIKSLDLALDNHLRAQDAIGTLGAVAVGNGTLELTGSLEVYLADGTLYDKFINNTASSISLRVSDAAGDGYVITIPKIKYKDAKVAAGGQDQDAMLSIPFEALYDLPSGKAILIDRIGV